MNTSVIAGKDLNPTVWDQFVMDSPQGNIYHCHHYLSQLLPDWEAVILQEGEAIVAAFPFQQRQKWGFSYAIQPHFAQYLGCLFLPKFEQAYKKLEFQKRAMRLIHETLPADIQLISYHFAPEFDYELPLQWLGWQFRQRYTYWVDIRKGYANFLTECATHVRREIKKATEAGISVRVENNPEKVIEILKASKPEAMRSIQPHFFKALENNARHYFQEDRSACLLAYEKERPIAGIIYFFYKNKMIYYQGSTLPEYRNSGAMSKIIAESVRLYEGKYEVLDFDGSMIEPIEHFFRGFGALPVKYGHFTLNRLPFWAKILHQWRQKKGL